MLKGNAPWFWKDVWFFVLNVSDEDLYSYYKVNFVLSYNHDYSLTELEDMLPWERDIYLSMLAEQIEKEKEEQRKQQ